jgi:SAM-dependent methyltransferase
MSNNHILDFWQAQAHKEGHNASWGDNWCVALEIDNIARYIKDGDRVLDVGCANGFAIKEQRKRHAIQAAGIDFSQAMIDEANNTVENIQFQVADVRALPFQDEIFDVTYTTRCLINLPTWEEQILGIKECIRVTKKGGTIVLSEAFYEPLQKLNALRLIAGLPPLVEHDFNRYLKQDKLFDLIMGIPEILSLDIIDFSSVYYLGSRFLRELITDIDKYSGYSNPINKLFYDLENEFSGGGFGIQQAYVIKK